MLNGARELMRLFRRRAAAESVGRAVRARVRMQVEEMEARILHSADFAPAAFADMTGAQVQMRVLETAPAAVQPAATQEARARELIVVDTATEHYQQLIDDIVAQDDGRSFDVLLVERDSDGVARVTDALSSLTEVAAVHIISHGSEGRIQLGASTIDIGALRERAAEIGAWSDALTADADLLIYGCDVAASPDGRLLIDALARLTGADVAASDDLTGSLARGGDWILEYHAGAIDAALAVSAAAQSSWQGTLGDTVLVSYDVPFNQLSDNSRELKSSQPWGQTFRYDSPGATYEVDKFSVVLYRAVDAEPNQTITLSLRSSWTGGVIASGTISSDALSTTEAWVTGTLAGPATLNDNQTYYIRVDSDGDGKVYVGAHENGTYSGGDFINKNGAAQNGKDMVFRVIDTVATVAPVLTGAEDLPAIGEDPNSNGGARVSDLIAGHVTDADPGALDGIAVTAVDDANGVWQYSTSGQGSWTAFGAVSASNARLLEADANTYVRFVPNANWNGTVANGLTFRAWDMTSGTAGGTADTTSTTLTVRDNFGAVSYSNNDGTANWTTNWIDTDGNPSSGNIKVTGGALVLSTLVGTDSIYREADLSGATSATLSFSFDNQLGLLGTVSVQASNDGGANYTTIGTFGSAPAGPGAISFDIGAYIAANTRIKLQMDGTLLGGSFTADDIQISYVTPLNGGNTAFSSATASASITVSAVNDRPIGTSSTVVTGEGTPLVFAAAHFGLTDPNDAPANNLLAVHITTLPTAGALTLSGAAVSAGQAISSADIAAGNLVFTPAADGSGAGYASFTFQVQDDGGTANGGKDLDTVARTLTIDVLPVNDAPVGTNNTVTATEDTPFVFDATAFGFGDPNDTPANNLLAVRIAALPTAGSLTLSGAAVTAGQSISAADIAAGNLAFTPAANISGPAYSSFTFQVQDDGGTANGGADLDAVARTMTINVNAVNDAPLGAGNTVVTAEDTPLVFDAASFGFSDPSDAPPDTFTGVRIAALAGAGSLRLSGTAVTAGQFISAADIAAGRLAFAPDANANGAGYASFTFQVQDDGGTANGGVNLDAVARTMTIDVTAVNDAPVGASNTVVAIEDTPFVFDTAAFGFADPSDMPANNLLAVTISSLPAAGSLMLNGAAVAAGQSVSAADIAAGRLAFMPAANANGAAHASFTFQVQDDGGGADLDAVARTMTIDVTAVNDAPAGTSGSVTTVEDTPFVFTAAAFGYSDPNDTPADNLLDVRIATLPAAGSLTLNGIAVTAGQFVSAADIDAGNLVFTPAPNATGAAYASFTFQVHDDGGGADLDPVARTLTIDVAAANDAPVGTSNTVVTIEDTAFVFSAAQFGFTDPNDAGANSLLAVRIASLPALGALTLSGGAVNTGQFIGLADIDAGNLVYTPAANGNGAGYASFTFHVQDDGGTAGGGMDLDALARTMTIDVTAVNDAPVIAGANNLSPLTENPATNPGTRVSALLFGAVTDPDSAALAGIAVTAVDNTNGVWQYSVDSGGTWLDFVNPQPTAARLLAADATTYVRFVPNANWSGTVPNGLTFRAWDQTSGVNGATASTDPGNGGASAFSTATASSTITVGTVNDAPMGTANTVVTLEGTPLVFDAAAFGFTDPSDVPANNLAAVRIAALPAAGALTLSGAAVTAGQLVGVADIAAGRLVFTPAVNGAGAAYATFSFQVQDDGGTANGGIDLDPVARTMTIDVTGINDAPVGTSGTVVAIEDTAFVFTTAVFGFSDPDDAPANTLAAVRIATLPAAGALRLSGAALIAGQSVSAADIAGGNLVFTPGPNANGAGYASFTFQVEDDGGTANGGVNVDPVANTLTIDIAAVNDAPVGTDNTVVAVEDTPFVFTTAAFGFSDPNDTPANAFAAVRIATLPAVGSLTLSGAAVTAGQSVSAADIAAGKLVFTPAAGASGAGYAGFTFRVQDDGGGADFDTVARTMTIDVAAVNDAPMGANNTIVTLEDTAFVFDAADFGFADPNDAPANDLLGVRIVSLPTTGTLALNATAVRAGQVVSRADIDAGGLVYIPAADAAGAAQSSFTFAVQDDGGTANGGADFDGVARTMTIDITPVNDAPAGVDRAVTLDEDTSFTFSAASFGFADPRDTPADSLLSVTIGALPSAGTLTLNGAAVVAGQTISVADIAAGKLVYAPPPNANGAAYANFGFRMQDDGGTANGGVDRDPVARTMSLDITAVNDMPRGTDKTVALAEDTPHAFSVADFGFTDPLDAPPNALAAVRIETLPGRGALTLNGAAVAVGQTISAAQITTGKLVFTPGANESGAAYASLGFRVQDNGGGADLDTTTRTLTMDVAAINDAPVLTSAGDLAVVAEDAANNPGTRVSDLIAGFVSDGDAGAMQGIAVTSVNNANGTWQYSTDGGSTWAGFGAPTAAAARLLAADVNTYVRFVPAADWNGTVENGLTFRAWDGTSGLAGAISDTTRGPTFVRDEFDSASYGNNDGASRWRGSWTDPDRNPLGGAIRIIGNELALTTFAGTTWVYREIDLTGAAGAVLSFHFDNDLGAAGVVALQVSNNGGATYTTIDTFSNVSNPGPEGDYATDISAYAAADTRIRFMITGTAFGGSFKVDDVQLEFDAPLTGGDTAFSSTVASSSITVSPVNDAPTGADRTVTTPANAAYTFDTAAFGFSDPLDVPANGFLAIQITSLPGTGSLELDNLPVVNGQFISTADVAAGKLRYVPEGAAVGAASASFTFNVQDDGGGADLALAARRITIDVTPPPVAAPVQVVENVIAPPTTETRASETVTSAAPAQAEEQTAAQASPSAALEVPAEAAPPAIGATAEDAPVNTVAAPAPAPVQQLDVQQPSREGRDSAPAPVDAQLIALADERAEDTGSFVTTSQTRTSTLFLGPTVENREMMTQLDQMREELQAEGELEASTIAATAATSLSLSVGYVIWLLRGGVLLSTLISSVPAWRFVDPLPVLGRMDDENDMDDEADDSLESLVARGDHAPETRGDEPETTQTGLATT